MKIRQQTAIIICKLKGRLFDTSEHE